MVTPLPIRTKEGYVVIYSRLMDTNIDHYDPMAQIRVCDMINWMWFMYMGTNPGQVMIMDMEGCTLAHTMKFNLVHMKKHMFYIQVSSFIVKNFDSTANFILGSSSSSTEGDTHDKRHSTDGETLGHAKTLHEEGINGFGKYENRSKFPSNILFLIFFF